MTAESAEMLRVAVLGPVRAWRGERELQLGGPRQRAVLAVLAMRANQVVSRAELIDALWGEDAPPSADSSVYTYVAGLRRVLEPDRPRRSPGRVLSSSASGYLLELPHGALDADTLRQSHEQGQEFRGIGDLHRAAEVLEAGLRLWNGTPLIAVPGPFAEVERAKLVELRLAVHQERAEVLLALGRHAELIVELRGLVQEYPLRERLRALLMLALHRTGQPADAVTVFQETRRALVSELGIEPGNELQRIHDQISDRSLDAPPADRAPFDRAAAELAAAVRRQWRTEAETRSLHRPEPVRLRWSSTGRPVAARAAAVLGRPPETGAPTRFDLRGDLTDLVAKFRRLPKRQLVVLGEPGAGKTVLAILLTLGLLEDLQPGEPVPVLLSVSSWNPHHELLQAWMARTLTEEYPGLANTAAYGPDAAARLVAEGRVMPVLDGLDEISPGLHQAAIDALDQTTAGAWPLVVTCRAAEYQQAVMDARTILSTAAVVEIEPVGADDAAAFLVAREPYGTSRWEPVIKHLQAGPDGPLALALSTPLMVDLARTAYAGATTDPAELLDATHFPDRAAIEGHLLDAFLPAVYARRPPPPARATEIRAPMPYRYDPDQARQWLAFLARHLHRTGTRDLAWWRLIQAIPRTTLGLVFGLPAALVFAFAGELAGGHAAGLVYGVAYALASCISNGLGTRPGPRRVEVRIRGTALRFLRRFAIGSTIGLVLGLAWSLRPGLVLALVLVFGFALAVPVWLDLPADATQVSSPSIVLRRERTATLYFVLSFALCMGLFYGVADVFTKQVRFVLVLGGTFDLVLSCAGGLAGALMGRFLFGPLGSWAYGLASAVIGGLVFPRAPTLTAGLTVGILFGLAVGLTFLSSRAWGAFTLGRAWLALHGHTPPHLMRFLADAHRRGVLRQTGAVYQFRHARLQDRLVRME